MMYLYLIALISLVAYAAGEALSGCSSDTQCPLHDVPKTLCVQVKGALDFPANSYYCDHEGVDGSYHSITTLQDSKLRYEIRSDDDIQWQLIRLTKTKRDWVELPIYRGLPTQDAHPQPQPQHLNWAALFLGSDSIDGTEPVIDVSIANVPSAVIESLHVLKEFQSDQIDACQFSTCVTTLSPLLVEQSNEQMCFLGMQVAASFANEIGNAKMAAENLDKARTCVRKGINQLVSNQKTIPRFLRWRVAETSYQMAQSFTKAGMLQAAIDATLVGLASSPLSRQKRKLFVTLGDLKLAAKETQAAHSAYIHARNAVRQKGGSIETSNFLQSFEDSVGDFIGQVVTNTSHSLSDLAQAIPNNYSQVRISLILHAEKDEVFGTWNVDADFETYPSVDPLTRFGRECDMGETSFDFCHSVV